MFSFEIGNASYVASYHCRLSSGYWTIGRQSSWAFWKRKNSSFLWCYVCSQDTWNLRFLGKKTQKCDSRFKIRVPLSVWFVNSWKCKMNQCHHMGWLNLVESNFFSNNLWNSLYFIWTYFITYTCVSVLSELRENSFWYFQKLFSSSISTNSVASENRPKLNRLLLL
jgi:hypothetical protein